jgi:hypothetical protein
MMDKASALTGLPRTTTDKATGEGSEQPHRPQPENDVMHVTVLARWSRPTPDLSGDRDSGTNVCRGPHVIPCVSCEVDPDASFTAKKSAPHDPGAAKQFQRLPRA